MVVLDIFWHLQNFKSGNTFIKRKHTTSSLDRNLPNQKFLENFQRADEISYRTNRGIFGQLLRANVVKVSKFIDIRLVHLPIKGVLHLPSYMTLGNTHRNSACSECLLYLNCRALMWHLKRIQNLQQIGAIKMDSNTMKPCNKFLFLLLLLKKNSGKYGYDRQHGQHLVCDTQKQT